MSNNGQTPKQKLVFNFLFSGNKLALVVHWEVQLATESHRACSSRVAVACADAELSALLRCCSYTRRACGIIVQHLLLLLETATGGLSGVFEPPTKAPRSVVTHWYQIAHFNSKGGVLWRFCKNILILVHFQFRKNTQKRVYFVCGRISDKFWPVFVVNFW